MQEMIQFDGCTFPWGSMPLRGRNPWGWCRGSVESSVWYRPRHRDAPSGKTAPGGGIHLFKKKVCVCVFQFGIPQTILEERDPVMNYTVIIIFIGNRSMILDFFLSWTTCWFTAVCSWRHKLCGKSRLSWSISAMNAAGWMEETQETSCFGYWPGRAALTLQTKEEPIPLNWWKRNFTIESSKPFDWRGPLFLWR